MTLFPETCYQIVCDGCGRIYEYGDVSTWVVADNGLKLAEDADWLIMDRSHFCPDCGPDSDEDEPTGVPDRRATDPAIDLKPNAIGPGQ